MQIVLFCQIPRFSTILKSSEQLTLERSRRFARQLPTDIQYTKCLFTFLGVLLQFICQCMSIWMLPYLFYLISFFKSSLNAQAQEDTKPTELWLKKPYVLLCLSKFVFWVCKRFCSYFIMQFNAFCKKDSVKNKNLIRLGKKLSFDVSHMVVGQSQKVDFGKVI